MDKLQIERLRDHLQNFNFTALFIEELGWSYTHDQPFLMTAQGQSFQIKAIAEMSGVVAFLVDGLPEREMRLAIHAELTKKAHENLVIFVDQMNAITQSLWLWMRRDEKRQFPREHLYVKGQPGDLFLSKLSGIVVDINTLDENGQYPLAQLLARMTAALDVERVTKAFFKEYAAQRLVFIELIAGVTNEKDRAWLASIVMNRLMFIWFLQRKHFLDGGNLNYLVNKLASSRQRGVDLFYSEFLQALFFEGFALPKEKRSAKTQALIGEIRFLNGGLFLPHRLEMQYKDTLQIPDAAFENLFKLFSSYSWHLDDAPGGQDNEINPDVLGYIFEKYVNQKAFGAYYTRPEITNYLCERTIHGLILAHFNTEHPFALPVAAGRKFESLNDLILHLDVDLCRELLQLLPKLKLLDPACGSGAFLVAAMKTLINIYSALIEKIKRLNDPELLTIVTQWETAHKSLAYFIKRTIITDNLFGVEIHEEAVEIAKLRLFLALVSSAQTVEQLEPLPNIDFNIVAGNSLIGLMHVNAADYEKHEKIKNKTGDLFRTSTYREMVNEKNRLIALYRGDDAKMTSEALATIKCEIESHKAAAQAVLNEILLNAMDQAGVRFEQANWDAAKNKMGKPTKRKLLIADIESLRPFHWGFEFDEVLARGGFDAMITNPPWEIVKPNAKEFFQEHSAVVTKNKMTIKEFEKEQDKLLVDEAVRDLWLAYLSTFAHQSAWFRAAPQFKFQSAVVNGKKTGSDINLYKLFVEQCANLLRDGGECGIVIPSGIYTDLGAKGLRDLLFNQNQVTGLFCFENREEIFEGVHRSFKFVVLTFAKGGSTIQFPAAFMRHKVAELATFPAQMGLQLPIELIRRLSPDSHSVMEFKSAIDVQIAEKMLKFPLLGETIEGTWNLRLTNEFHMTNDSHLFKTEPGAGRLPLYEGKMIHQFEFQLAEPRYWIEINKAESILRAARIRNLTQKLKNVVTDNAVIDALVKSDEIPLDHHRYRFGFRDIAASTNKRAMICSVLPPHIFAGNTLNLLQPYVFEVNENGWIDQLSLDAFELLFVVACFNSFIVDWLLRQKITSHLNMFYVYQIPIPRLTATDPAFLPIVHRAAQLICLTPEFDELAAAVGLESHRDGVNDTNERAQLRAELDGLIAHLYGLTDDEFAHVLATFPLVDKEVKAAALAAYRNYVHNENRL